MSNKKSFFTHNSQDNLKSVAEFLNPWATQMHFITQMVSAHVTQLLVYHSLTEDGSWFARQTKVEPALFIELPRIKNLTQACVISFHTLLEHRLNLRGNRRYWDNKGSMKRKVPQLPNVFLISRGAQEIYASILEAYKFTLFITWAHNIIQTSWTTPKKSGI